MDQFVQEYLTAIAIGLFVVGVVLGRGLEVWSKRMCRQFRLSQNYEPVEYPGLKFPATELLTGILFAAYFLAVFRFGAHSTDVLPSLFWKYGRGVAHLILIALLVAGTAADFREYIIPDQVTVTGVVLGVGIAVASGDTQLMHLWVDWNQEIPDLQGPYIPEWIKNSLYLHGLAWSLAGLAAGAGITWLVRVVSSLILGQESLGFGDVTLMGMIGCFIGWQAIVFVFLLAPLCGIFAGLAARGFTNRSYVPYGPYLALSTIGVLFSWRWLWMLESPGAFSMRRFFGDAVGLAILAGISLASLVLLLGSVRFYRAIPTGRSEVSEEAQPEAGSIVGLARSAHAQEAGSESETIDASEDEGEPPEE
jgi:leader peptidase (prepilin peptidase)/N-methyltransferase